MASGPISFDLRELRTLRKQLKRAEDLGALPRFKVALAKAGQVVADDARRRVSSRSGTAVGSIRSTSSGSQVYVIGGKASIPYYGWLDFGSRKPVIGNPRSRGPWKGSGKGPEGGRFIYPAIEAKSGQVIALVESAIAEAIED